MKRVPAAQHMQQGQQQRQARPGLVCNCGRVVITLSCTPWAKSCTPWAEASAQHPCYSILLYCMLNSGLCFQPVEAAIMMKVRLGRGEEQQQLNNQLRQRQTGVRATPMLFAVIYTHTCMLHHSMKEVPKMGLAHITVL